MIKLAKWKIVARPDEEDYDYGLRPQEKVIEAGSYEEAIQIAWREYPEYHQVGAYEIKRTSNAASMIDGHID